MIAAGLGFRTGVGAREIIAAIDAALAAHRLPREALAALATLAAKAEDKALLEASQILMLPLLIPDRARLNAANAHCLTQSAASLAASGLNSVSESAALAALGARARLLGQ